MRLPRYAKTRRVWTSENLSLGMMPPHRKRKVLFQRTRKIGWLAHFFVCRSPSLRVYVHPGAFALWWSNMMSLSWATHRWPKYRSRQKQIVRSTIIIYLYFNNRRTVNIIYWYIITVICITAHIISPMSLISPISVLN